MRTLPFNLNTNSHAYTLDQYNRINLTSTFWCEQEFTSELGNSCALVRVTKIRIEKFLHSYRDDFPEHLGKNNAYECKKNSLSVNVRRCLFAAIN